MPEVTWQMDFTFNQQKNSHAFIQKPQYHPALKLIEFQILAQDVKSFLVFSVNPLRLKNVLRKVTPFCIAQIFYATCLIYQMLA